MDELTPRDLCLTGSRPERVDCGQALGRTPLSHLVGLTRSGNSCIQTEPAQIVALASDGNSPTRCEGGAGLTPSWCHTRGCGFDNALMSDGPAGLGGAVCVSAQSPGRQTKWKESR